MEELKMTEVIRLNLFHSISLDSDILYADLFLPNNFCITFNFCLFFLIGYLSILIQLFPVHPISTPMSSGGRERVH